MIYVGAARARIKKISFNPVKLNFGAVDIDSANVVLRKYAGDPAVNISLWAQKFKKKQTKNPFVLNADRLNLTRSRFIYINDLKRTVQDTQSDPDIDYAYFELKDIHAKTRKFHIHGSDISTAFKHLAFNQYGGFSLSDASGDFRICDTTLTFDHMKLATPFGRLDGDLCFKYERWASYGNFNDSVHILAAIRPSTLSLRDIAGFVPALKGMDETIELEVDRFDGCINRFNLTGLYGGWGMRNRLRCSLSVQNITDFKHARINLQLDTCDVNIPELEHFTLPHGKHIVLNKTLSKFGNTSFSGRFAGTPPAFDLSLGVHSDAGTCFADFSTFPVAGRLEISGSLTSPNFDVAKLTEQPKVLGYSDFDLSLGGRLDAQELTVDNFRTLKAHLSGLIHRFDLYHYPVSQIGVEGNYQDGQYSCSLDVDDPHMDCDFTAEFAMNESLPVVKSSINLHHFDIGAIASPLPAVDSATVGGLGKIIYIAQQNPSLQIGVDDFSLDIKGSRPDNVNGCLRCDSIHFRTDDNTVSIALVRLTAGNVGKLHNFTLASSVASASLSTTYPLSGIVDSLKAITCNFFPNLLAAQTQKQPVLHNPMATSSDSLEFHLNTHHAHQFLHLFMPNLFLSPTAIDLVIHAGTAPDTLNICVLGGSYKHRIKAYHLSANACTSDRNTLYLAVHADSLIAVNNNNHLIFKDININTSTKQNSTFYNIYWHDNTGFHTGQTSVLSGIIDASNPDDILVNFRNSVLYVRDMAWRFNNDNAVHIRDRALDFDNLLITNKISEIAVNGTYNRQESGTLSLKLKHVNMSVLNPLLSNMTFGGDLSASVSLETRMTRTFLTGRMLVSDFAFNNAPMGNLFMVAGRKQSGFIGCGGGIFRRNEPLNSNIITNTDYKYSDFENEERIVAKIKGNFFNDVMGVYANFDTLNIGFLTPFLSGFSDNIQGTASGNLSFYAKPDTNYFDGDVHVLRAQMGISALGTNYLIQNQHITFNREGIFFDNMKIQDRDNNIAYLNGSVKHRSFRDMKIDLAINTDRIMVLNTPKSANSAFYGTGYVAGKVALTGSGNRLKFRGPAIQTLEGSKIVLQVGGNNITSQSDIIHFKAKGPVAVDSLTGLLGDTLKKSTLDFDFTFKITNSTEVVLLLNSIGGTLNGRTDGEMQLTFNDGGLNLYGNLEVHSGDFKISPYNVIAQKFTLVPGGRIIFDGPLENMIVRASAYKSSKTSLANIIPSEYFSGSSANTNVNAYIRLDGPLMQQIDPVFSFELPNSSDETRNLFYSAIDTSNRENITKQFAYFLLTGDFMPEDMFSGNAAGIGISGQNTLGNIVNSMFNSLLVYKHGSFDIVYSQATERSLAEYGLKANANLLKDRMVIETGIGYYDDHASQGNNARSNMYGDFTVEYSLNKSGTWKAKVYTYLGERDEDYYLHDSQINYTAGVTLVYKQEFNVSRRKKLKGSATQKLEKRDEKQ